MTGPTLTARVEILEQKMQILDTLPGRIDAVELQILQLREEMRGEFSAVRAEIRGGDEALRIEIRAGDEETRRYMRLLHEDVISRIEMLGSSRHPRKKK